jgi:hypothetical protein
MDNVEVLQSKEAGSRRLFEEDELKWLDEEEFDARVIADKFVMHQADKSLVPGTGDMGHIQENPSKHSKWRRGCQM